MNLDQFESTALRIADDRCGMMARRDRLRAGGRDGAVPRLRNPLTTDASGQFRVGQC
jgi:hypothetical protein